MTVETLRAGNRSIEVSKADKVFFPSEGITKGAMAEYYQQVASTMVRYTDERALAAERYPEGITGERIFQKNVPEHFPDWIRRVDVPKKEGGTTVHAVCHSAATLVYLADQACVTPHLWLSRIDALDTPDRMIFDLDPSEQDLGMLRTAARTIRDLVEELGLVAYLMTTGSRGYHVVVPLRREQDFDSTRDFARQLAAVAVTREPDTLTVEQRKEDRGDRIFLDYLRNAYGQTAVAPYAVRARDGAPAATPLWWDELDVTEPWSFTIDNVPARLREHGDPWSDLGNHARSLGAPQRQLRELQD